MSSWHEKQTTFAIITFFLQDVLATKKGKERKYTCHTHTDLWFDGAVDGWGASGLHAAAAEGLGAGREGGVRDAVGHFVLQRRRALSVQLGALLHLGQGGHTPPSLTAHRPRLGGRGRGRPPPGGSVAACTPLPPIPLPQTSATSRPDNLTRSIRGGETTAGLDLSAAA